MEKKELLEALSEHGKAIELKNADFQKAVEVASAESKAEVEKLKSELSEMEKTKVVMQIQLDELDIEIQKVKKEPSAKTVTFAAELKEQLTKQACTTCTHYKTIVDAYTDKPLHKVCHKPDTCYGDMISNPDTHCCEYWEEKQCE